MLRAQHQQKVRRVVSPETTLITGAGGFIGGRLADLLRAKQEKIHLWTRNEGDLRDEDAVRNALARIRPARIYHLASMPPGPGDDRWLRIADEQRMITNLVRHMPTHCQLLYTGSMAEYGRSGVFRENDFCTPDTSYGCAKHSGTNLCVALRGLHGLDIRVARLFGVYGPGEGPGRLLPMLIAKLGERRVVPLSDGGQVRDFIHVDDVCHALQDLANASVDAAPAICNIGTGSGIPVRDLCLRVARILNADPTLLEFGAIPRRTVDQDCLVADIDVMRHITLPPPQRWLDDILARRIVTSMVTS